MNKHVRDAWTDLSYAVVGCVFIGVEFGAMVGAGIFFLSAAIVGRMRATK